MKKISGVFISRMLKEVLEIRNSLDSLDAKLENHLNNCCDENAKEKK